LSREPAIALLQFDSVAIGTHAADAMVKRAPITTLRAGTVQPGKYLVLIGGAVAVVEESYFEGIRVGGEALTDQILLPDVHEQVYAAVSGKRQTKADDSLGIIEVSGLSAMLIAADRAVKSADVRIIEIRLGDGLGGKGLTHLTGKLESVQAAIEAGLDAIQPMTASHTIIPALDAELRKHINRSTEFTPS
jgi:bacterial microcompartment shell protein